MEKYPEQYNALPVQIRRVYYIERIQFDIDRAEVWTDDHGVATWDIFLKRNGVDVVDTWEWKSTGIKNPGQKAFSTWIKVATVTVEEFESQCDSI